MSTNGFFTATTTQRNRLLRPFSQINNLSFSNLPLGEVKVHSLQVNVNRRFSDGFTANAAMSFNSSRSNRTVEEYDREPTLWWDDNNSRPFRLSGGAVYELPFGAGKADAEGRRRPGRHRRRVADGWHLRISARVADHVQHQLVLLRQYRGHQEGQARDCPERRWDARCRRSTGSTSRTSSGIRRRRRRASRRAPSRSRSTACGDRA